MTEHDGPEQPNWLAVEPETAKPELAKLGELAKETREAVTERVARIHNQPRGATDMVSGALYNWQDAVMPQFEQSVIEVTKSIAEFADDVVMGVKRLQETEEENAEEIGRATKHLEGDV